MENMRQAAKENNAKMSDDQHESFSRFHGLMDANRDGKVSTQEYYSFIRERYSCVPKNLFGLLDKYNTGYLDYEECIVFFYMVAYNTFVFCNGCGSYFVCFECYPVGWGNYNLCLSCHQNYIYNHEQICFMHNYELHHNKPWEVNASGVVGRNPYKRANMVDLVTTAGFYYEKTSPEAKASAHHFFNSLDGNNDGKVSLHEFLGVTRELGHFKMGSSRFFAELDNDRNGTLEFKEVMALYYIIKSGRPFCSVCDEFIPTMYFTCSVCYENENKFCVCPSCFQVGKFNHEHLQFLDNFALLEAKRMHGTANQYKPNSSVTTAELPTSTTNASDPYEKPSSRRKIALKVFDTAVSAAFNAAATAAAQSMSCTIM